MYRGILHSFSLLCASVPLWSSFLFGVELMESRRVVITGIGWITPLGHDIESVWKRLLNAESGIAPTTIFDASTFPTQFAAEVKDFDLAAFLGDRYDDYKHCSHNV